MRLKALFFCVFLAGWNQSQAASLASSCTMDQSGRIDGESVNKRLPIASVSKVMTSWWSQAVGGADYRFTTRFHITPSSFPGYYDMHIQGSRDPYFGRQSLQFAISELNRHGISRISNLTFDEKFKFYLDVTSGERATGFYTTSSPSPRTVLSQLKSMRSFTDGWDETLRLAKSMNIPFNKKGYFKVRQIQHQPSSDFRASYDTKTLTMKSSPLIVLLKEMNRNSNNHAANQIFEHFGGAAAFKRFASDRLNLTENDIRFLNGSGDRVDFESGSSAYNEASCAAVVKVIKDLRDNLRRAGHDCEDVLALSGGDPSSTVSKIYQNDVTRNSLIAKTGTVNPAITLAGLIKTKDGDIYFMFNYDTNGTTKDWRSARTKIRTQITELIRKHNGGKPIRYSAFRFASVDSQSIFEGDFMDEDGLENMVKDIPYGRPQKRPDDLISSHPLAQRPLPRPANLVETKQVLP